MNNYWDTMAQLCNAISNSDTNKKLQCFPFIVDKIQSFFGVKLHLIFFRSWGSLL